MCGIAGVFTKNIETHGLIERMTERIAHRGPDATGYFKDDRIHLGHQRLSIIDLSEEANQPFHSSDNRFAMVYNGEVYNFKEIAEELECNPRTKSDTEIVLQAFIQWGEDFTDKLNGMFAIAIYDRESGVLRLWRDRFGIKPLCYYWDGKVFAFASEMKALYELPVRKEVDEKALQDYLFLEYIPRDRSAMRNFHKLGNGEMLVYEKEQVRKKKYYDILDKLNEEPINEKDALERMGELLDSSLRYRLIADVPVGAFLSGGTDSSLVSAGLHRLGIKAHTYNIAFDVEQYDESTYAKEVAQRLGHDFHSFRMKSDDLLSDFDRIFLQYDEPFAVASVFPTSKVAELSRKDVKVALSGDGGDELFMGYGHYQWFDRLNKLDGFAGRLIRKSASALLSGMPSRFARIAKLLDYGSLKADWPHIWSQEQYLFTEKEIGRLTSQFNKVNSLNNSWMEIQKATKDPYLRISLFDLRHYLADDLLHKVDMASMMHGLEVRLPLLDHRLVEFAVNLPSVLKIQSGTQKYLPKKFLEKHLSKDLIYRKKWGFGAPVDRWLHNELSPLIDEYLLNDSSGPFDQKEVRDLVKKYRGGMHYLNKRIWALIVWQIWHQKFVKN